MRVIRKTIISSISLMVFLFVGPLGAARYIWYNLVLKQQSPPGITFITEAYAVVLSSVEEALRSVMPDANDIKSEIKELSVEQREVIAQKAKIEFDPIYDKEFQFYIGRTNGQIVGYAVEDFVKGKWGPIHYLLSLDVEGHVKNIIVLEYKERRGKPVATRRFLKQFLGKTVNDRITLKKDIRSVSGATISSRGMTNGIRKLVYIFNETYTQEYHAKK